MFSTSTFLNSSNLNMPKAHACGSFPKVREFSSDTIKGKTPFWFPEPGGVLCLLTQNRDQGRGQTSGGQGAPSLWAERRCHWVETSWPASLHSDVTFTEPGLLADCLGHKVAENEQPDLICIEILLSPCGKEPSRTLLSRSAPPSGLLCSLKQSPCLGASTSPKKERHLAMRQHERT